MPETPEKRDLGRPRGMDHAAAAGWSRPARCPPVSSSSSPSPSSSTTSAGSTTSASTGPRASSTRSRRRASRCSSRLDRDVDAVVFLRPQDDLYQPVKELLSRYAAASRRIHVRMIDPEKNPIEARQLVDQYQVTTPGDRHRLGQRPPGPRQQRSSPSSTTRAVQLGQRPEMTGFKGEQLFTGAIMQLVERRKPKILFTTGHGEASLDDRGPRGFSGVEDLLGARQLRPLGVGLARQAGGARRHRPPGHRRPQGELRRSPSSTRSPPISTTAAACSCCSTR